MPIEEQTQALTKMQQDTVEFRAEMRDLFQTVVFQQEEARMNQEASDKKIDAHIKKVEPILEALVITKLVIQGIKWGSAALTAAATLWLLSKQIIRGY